MTSDSDRVRRQYEQFPYPPVSALALPRGDQGAALSYQRAIEMAEANGVVVTGAGNRLRILVAGCGTLEALVVAQAHPNASEIVAVDLSQHSLDRLQRRIRWARSRDAIHLKSLWGKRLPPIRLVQADICRWQDGDGFDYILANNLLQHTPDPAATLAHLSGLLRPGGVLRMVTYPAMSRLWVRQTSAWLQWHGLNQDSLGLVQRAKQVIAQLPEGHPIRGCFNNHSETDTAAGLVDAFFHACERPLPPLLWQQASEAAGLLWLGESQTPYAQAGFIDELLPQAAPLSGWQKLQLLDDLLELTSNPIWWFCKRGKVETTSAPAEAAPNPEIIVIEPGQVWYLPSNLYWQLGQAARRADGLLQSVGSSVVQLVAVLREEVGPRVDRNGDDVPNLTIGEYPLQHLLAATAPAEYRCSCTDRPTILYYEEQPVPGTTLQAQIDWLQLRYGAEQAKIGPLRLLLAESKN